VLGRKLRISEKVCNVILMGGREVNISMNIKRSKENKEGRGGNIDHAARNRRKKRNE